ncbi:MAG: AAA family ATPase [Bacteroidales bacterium]|nr:AAA family ATPase [Bacteroidales bacterium]
MLLDYIDKQVHTNEQTYYVILDEVQLVEDFVEVLLGLMQDNRHDVYVSGSNSKFLSKDVVTEFRGRGDEIRMYPLSFSEYYAVLGGDKHDAWNNYYTYPIRPQ